MFANYLKLALRNIYVQKGYSFINIFGFSLGITCCLLILLYVTHELSYDRFHSKADRIYRVVFNDHWGQSSIGTIYTAAPVAEGFREEFPEVENATRFMHFRGDQVVRFEDKNFNEKKMLRADANFFEIFDFNIIEGDPATALVDPNTVILTESTAKKYFGSMPAMGQILTLGEPATPLKVTGIVEDIPENSHFDFDMLVSMAGYERALNTNWLSCFLYTYVLLKEGATVESLDAKLPGLYAKYFGPLIEGFMKISWEEFREQGNDLFYTLQPLEKIHLCSHSDNELKPSGSITNLFIFAMIAVFILIIACINYMNLATARATKRAKEVGVRKVLGANRRNLICQFMTESMLFSFIAMVIAIGLIELFTPIFRNVSGVPLTFSIFHSWWIPVGLVLLTVLIGFISGSYPALFLTLFQPVEILRSKAKAGKGSARLRSGLVIFQFAISIGLILSTVMVYRQLQYIRDKNLGYNRDNVVIVKNAHRLGQQKESFRQALKTQTDIISTSSCEAIPARGGYNGTFFKAEISDNAYDAFQISEDDQISCHFEADVDYLKTMGMELVSGRNFSDDMGTDQSAVIINEAAARMFGWENPVGKFIYGTGMQNVPKFQIIGLLRDYHLSSLHKLITPVIMMRGSGNYIAARIQSDHVPETIRMIENIWNEFAPNVPFVYSFLDEEFDALFRAEQRFGKLVGYFSVLTIFIACLGAFGLATFSAEQRTKEIGIRKSLGASISQVVLLLTRDFTRMVALAFILIVPVAWYAMSRWLENFAYRTNISIWVFLFAGIAAILFAWLTVSYQAIRAATTNPVKALRYE